MAEDAVRILTEKQLRGYVKLDEQVIAQIEQGFAELESGNAEVPPIMMIPVPERDGEVDVKSAFIRGLPSMAIKIASGFFQNHSLGLPSQSGQMLVVSSETGFLQAVLLDNGYLTQVRTAAAGAIAAKYLAPRYVENVGVFGCGVQARFQMEALHIVRPFKRIYMYSIDSEERQEEFCAYMKKKLKVEVVRPGSGEETAKRSSIVVTTTPSRQGFFKPEWVHPKLHITAMGSDAEDKQELLPEVFRSADIIACDLKSQCFRLGELRSALKEGVITEETPVQELGAIILGRQSGRVDEDQVTVCDLTGVGVQDTMIALTAYETARKKDGGIQISRQDK